MIDQEYGLAQVLLAIPKTYHHIDFVCMTRDGTTFWTTNDQIKPPHKIRWRRKIKPKRKRRRKPKRVGRRPLHVKVNDPQFGIYLYRMRDITPSDVLEFPCVKIFENGNIVTLEFYRHYYAKGLVAEETVSVNISEGDLIRLAAKHAAAIYKERY